MRRALPATALLLLILRGSACGAVALPAGCARVETASVRGSAGGFDATGFVVQLERGPGRRAHPALMSASDLQVSSAGAPLSQAVLERAASASAASLLLALAGHGGSVCPDGLLEQAGAPVAAALGLGARLLAVWRDVTLRGAAGLVHATRMQLRLESADGGGPERPVHMALSLDGVTGSLSAPTLLPERLSVQVTLPAASLPTLLAATGGDAPDAQIPVTVDDIRLSQGDTVLSGHGVATAAATPMESATRLKLTAQHFDALVERSALLGLVRLHTALLLSALMGRPGPDGIAWDVRYQDGLLAVNDLPIPLR